MVTVGDYVSTTPETGRAAADVAPEPSRFSLRHPKSRLGFVRPRVWLPLVLMIVVLGALWEWGASSMPYLLPKLSAIGRALADDPGYYLDNALVTLWEALLGLAIGFAAAFVLAVLVSELPWARRAIMPVAVVLNVTPLVAIAPVLVVAFGFGPEPKLIVTGLICFFPILINTSVGLRAVPPAVVQVYRTVNASRLEMLWWIRVPSSLPFLFAALRIVFPLSIVGAVVAEMSAPGAAEGLGTAISLASTMNQLAVVYASIAILALMGSLLLLIVTTVERRMLHWHESTQGANY
ncbi:ABC transporter permease [Kibdelosporangium philippinense]|uniref:ABC transporter permease n=1 Tax=Kibdelosporangium philippinense TaxID=211113 RepID=A0ABS8Z6T5_9PSEU|nr:ABC transporter permease [Kibdelosporangium philippinense]MCE7003585.1 ABC transporter permease [Kibdelosporangium philippinense]